TSPERPPPPIPIPKTPQAPTGATHPSIPVPETPAFFEFPWVSGTGHNLQKPQLRQQRPIPAHGAGQQAKPWVHDAPQPGKAAAAASQAPRSDLLLKSG